MSFLRFSRKLRFSIAFSVFLKIHQKSLTSICKHMLVLYHFTFIDSFSFQNSNLKIEIMTANGNERTQY